MQVNVLRYRMHVKFYHYNFPKNSISIRSTYSTVHNVVSTQEQQPRKGKSCAQPTNSKGAQGARKLRYVLGMKAD